MRLFLFSIAGQILFVVFLYMCQTMPLRYHTGAEFLEIASTYMLL